MTRNRLRGLTSAEAELWRAVQVSVRPLKPAGAPLAEASAPALAAAGKFASAEPAARPVPGVKLGPVPDPVEAVPRMHPRMDKRRFERLRRGKLEPEARLDLHGLGRTRAHDELVGFLLSAHAAGLRLVLVITGKGRRPGDGERPGVLRHSLPHWLAAPPLTGRVLDIAPAHPRHGGAGAFYVYLRRSRGG